MIPLKLWMSEVHNGSRWTHIKGSVGLSCFAEAPWDKPSLAFPDSRGALLSLANGPFHPYSQESQIKSLSHCITLSLAFMPLSSLFKDPVIALGPPG